MEVLKVALATLLLVYLIRRKTNLGLAMGATGLALAVLFQMSPGAAGRSALDAVLDFKNISLIIALILISTLEKVMDLKQLVGSLTNLVGDNRLVAAMLPAFMGLLPSPGGAAFSAPMVGEASTDMGISPERKSFINYWYRHPWEYVFPLYPGFILAMQMTSMPPTDIIKAQYPLTIMAILAAIPFAFYGVKNSLVRGENNGSRTRYLLDLVLGIWPVFAIIVMVLVLKLEIALSLAVALLALMAVKRYSPKRAVDVFRAAFNVNTVILVLGAMFFKEILMDSGAVKELSYALTSAGIPLILLFIAIPFLAGILTGLAIGFVGVSFPILLGLLDGGVMSPHLLALAYASGFAGQMLSPTHLCLVLTLHHFKADFGRTYRMVLIPQGAVLGLAAVLYFVSR